MVPYINIIAERFSSRYIHQFTWGFENGYIRKCLFVHFFLCIMEFIHSFIRALAFYSELCFCNGNIVYGKVQLNPCFVYISYIYWLLVWMYEILCERELFWNVTSFCVLRECIQLEFLFYSTMSICAIWNKVICIIHSDSF